MGTGALIGIIVGGAVVVLVVIAIAARKSTPKVQKQDLVDNDVIMVGKTTIKFKSIN